MANVVPAFLLIGFFASLYGPKAWVPEGMFKGISLDSEDSFTSANFTLRDLNAKLCGFIRINERENKTILIVMMSSLKMQLGIADKKIVTELFLKEELIGEDQIAITDHQLEEHLLFCTYHSHLSDQIEVDVYLDQDFSSLRIPNDIDWQMPEVNETLRSGSVRSDHSNGTIYIGDPFILGNSFNGSAFFFLFQEATYLDHPIDYCNKGPKALKDLTKDLSWHSNGSTTSVELSITKLCDSFSKVVVINATGIDGFGDQQVQYCSRLGGRSLSNIELIGFQDEFLPRIKNKCKDKNGSITTLVWTSKNCKLMDLETLKVKKTCFPEHACFICVINKIYFHITSPNENAFQLLSNLEFVEGGDNLNNPDHYMLKYSYDSDDLPSITFEEGMWILRIEEVVDSYFLNTSLTPMGTHLWHSQIDKGRNQNFTIDNCGRNWWPCNDGACYKDESYCDGVNDCEDGTDEAGCGLPYRSRSDHFFGKKPIIVDYSVSLVEMDPIKASDGVIKIGLNLTFDWKDGRVKFRKTLDDSFNGTELPFNPTTSLHLAQCQNGFKLQESISQSLFWVDQEDFFYKTISSEAEKISNNITLSVELPCEFDFFYFPFGEQTCRLCFWHNCQPNGCKFRKKLEETLALNTSNKERGDFYLEEITHQTLHGEKKVEVRLFLKNLSSYYILTSFTPSVLLIFVCYSSLFFDLENFNERIMVSLMGLLTLMLLFTEVSSKIIKTSYIKLIDVWFIYCLIFATLVAIVNAIIHYKQKFKTIMTAAVEEEEGPGTGAKGSNDPFGQVETAAEDKKEKIEKKPGVLDNFWSFSEMKFNTYARIFVLGFLLVCLVIIVAYYR